MCMQIVPLFHSKFNKFNNIYPEMLDSFNHMRIQLLLKRLSLQI